MQRMPTLGAAKTLTMPYVDQEVSTNTWAKLERVAKSSLLSFVKLQKTIPFQQQLHCLPIAEPRSTLPERL